MVVFQSNFCVLFLTQYADYKHENHNFSYKLSHSASAQLQSYMFFQTSYLYSNFPGLTFAPCDAFNKVLSLLQTFRSCLQVKDIISPPLARTWGSTEILVLFCQMKWNKKKIQMKQFGDIDLATGVQRKNSLTLHKACEYMFFKSTYHSVKCAVNIMFIITQWSIKHTSYMYFKVI